MSLPDHAPAGRLPAKPPRLAPPDFIDRLKRAVPRLIEAGARYDAVPLFPRDSVDAILGTGLTLVFAPAAIGGRPFASARQENTALFEVLRILGRADLSVGRLFEGHVNALKLFDWFGSERQQKHLQSQLSEGGFYGVWATEPMPGVDLLPDEGGWRLTGAKSFATGAGGLSHAVVTARGADGDTRMVIVPADIDDRADLTGWRVRGMRATGSGRYRLEGLRPHADDLLGEAGDYTAEPRFTAGAWRFLAVQLGGVEGLLMETRTAISQEARDDPLKRAKFADAVAAARTAYLWGREAAQRAADDAHDAPDFVRMARGVVERAALDMMELSARIVGSRSAFDGERIDKIIRDLSLYLRQAGPDQARDAAARTWLERDAWGEDDRLW